MHYNSFEYNERKTVMFKCSWCFLDCLWHMFRMAKLKSRSTFKHTNTRSMWSNGKWEIRWTNKFDLCDLCDSERKTWKRHLLIKVQPIIRTISATLCKIVEFFTLRWFRAKKPFRLSIYVHFCVARRMHVCARCNHTKCTISNQSILYALALNSQAKTNSVIDYEMKLRFTELSIKWLNNTVFTLLTLFYVGIYGQRIVSQNVIIHWKPNAWALEWRFSCCLGLILIAFFVFINNFSSRVLLKVFSLKWIKYRAKEAKATKSNG